VELPRALRLLDLALTHAVYLEAIREYLARGGRSRGSYLVPDPAGRLPCPGLDGRWAFSLSAPEDFVGRHILEIGLDASGKVIKDWVGVRPVPRAEGWFETVWNDHLRDRIVRRED